MTRVHDNGVLRRIFGPKAAKLTRDWRKLRNEFSSLNIIRMIKLKKIRWQGNVACVEKIS
jgi:hypothetical protein